MQRLPTAAILALVAATASLARADVRSDAMGNMQIISSSRTLEGYVPTDASAVPIAAIELRNAVTISGKGEVTLRQVCRWAESDNDRFAAVADLVVLKLDGERGYGTVDVEQIQTALSDAGVAAGSLNFSGAMRCTVSRTDVTVDEGQALRDWIATQESPRSQPEPAQAVVEAAPVPTPAPTPQPTLDMTVVARPAEPIEVQPAHPVAAAPASAQSTGDLRAMLISDIAARTRLPVNRLHVDFAAQDRALLSLASPVQFAIEPQRYGDLGETSWYVTINPNTANARRVRVSAKARAWVDQVVLKRTVNTREAIGVNDVEMKPALLDRLAPDNIVATEQVVGKQAAREIRAGTVLSDRMIAPLELVRAGQAVTVSMRRGSIQIRSVATALQAGAIGDAVRVRNPSTNEVYEVQLTGPQTGIVTGSDPVMADANH